MTKDQGEERGKIETGGCKIGTTETKMEREGRIREIGHREEGCRAEKATQNDRSKELYSITKSITGERPN